MAELMRFSAFAVRQALVMAAGSTVKGVYEFLQAYCSDPQQALPRAVERASEQTWQAVELALLDSSGLRARLQVAFAPGVVKGVAAPLRQLVAERDPAFREGCRGELARLQRSSATDLSWQQAAASFPHLQQPEELLQQARSVLAEEVTALRTSGLEYLPELIALELPQQGGPLLLHLFNSFLRAEVMGSPELSQALNFSFLETLSEQQVQVLGLLEEILERLPTQVAWERLVQPGTTAILHGLDDQRVFEALLHRAQTLPAANNNPDIADALGRLGMATGQFPEAAPLFASSAALHTKIGARAEAHYNEHRAALEQQQWDAACAALLRAAELDPERFEPFPFRKYSVQRILGAGGFGTAFLCEDQHLKTPVVIKTLHQTVLERGAQAVFREAQLLQALRHPAIIEMRHCDFADREETRPYLVMAYLRGQSLEEFLARHGRLNATDARQLGIVVAEGMRAAHTQGVLHRDLKPANLLVRKNGGWSVRLIDFGLALRVQQLRETVLATQPTKSLFAESAGGTYQYAAPEQMGLRAGEVGPHSDVFGFGKLMCQAVFGTTNPTRRDWRALEVQNEALAELLSNCIEEEIGQRLPDFDAVLKDLHDSDPGKRPEPAITSTVKRSREKERRREENPRAEAQPAATAEQQAKIQGRAAEAEGPREEESTKRQHENESEVAPQHLVNPAAPVRSKPSWWERFWSGSDAGDDRVPASASDDRRPRIGHTGRYLDNGDGTVTDVETGLQWMRCSLGRPWNGTDCDGEASAYGWKEALSAAKELNRNGGYAGYRDWRVPTVEELNSLVYCSSGKPGVFPFVGKRDHLPCEGNNQEPTIDLEAFPGAEPSSFWSASPSAGHSDYAWLVFFGNGGDFWLNECDNYRVRLVRGGQ